MIKVDVIWSGSLKGSIGPSGTLRRLLESREYLLKREIDLTVFSVDNHAGDVTPPVFAGSYKLSYRVKFKRYVKKWLMKLSRYSMKISKWMIERLHPGVESLVKDYLSLNRTPDVVVFHSGYEAYVYLQLTNVDNCFKTVAFYHSDGIPEAMTVMYYPIIKGTKYLESLLTRDKFVAKSICHHVFITHIGKVNFLRYYPFVKEEDTSVIVNGINDLKEMPDYKVDNQSEGFKYRLCCTGTINNRKGQRIIIEALTMLDENTRKQIHLTLLGSGPDEPMLREMVKKNKIDKNVYFAGNVNNNEIPSYLRLCNIFILMSYNEGLPISILEAMSMGLPVISTNRSGIPETVDVGYNGILINPDSKELLEIFNKMDTYKWGEMGINSRKKYEKQFTFERMKVEYSDMIHKVVGK